MFDPNQPRIPKHHHGGGRWTRGGYGMLSDLGMLHPRQHDENNAQPTLADLPHYAWLQDINERRADQYTIPAWSGRQPPSLDPTTAGAAAVAGWSLLDRLRGGISAEEARGWDEYERLSKREQCGSPCGHYVQGGSISTWPCESAQVRRSGAAHA